MNEGESLDQLGSDILFLLWKRQWDGEGSLVTAADLHKVLLKDLHVNVELRSVKRSLASLKEAALVESAQAARPANHSGPAPAGYRIAPDPPLITRRSTAQILVSLHHHRLKVVPEQALIAEILKMDLRRDDTGLALTAEDILNQLLWCIGQGYVKASEKDTDPENPGGQRRLCTTCKVDGELLFLERICARKGPSSALRAIPRVYEGVAVG